MSDRARQTLHSYSISESLDRSTTTILSLPPSSLGNWTHLNIPLASSCIVLHAVAWMREGTVEWTKPPGRSRTFYSIGYLKRAFPKPGSNDGQKGRVGPAERRDRK